MSARADDIPLDPNGFTAYIQQKLQLYSAAPVRVTGPFAVAIGAQSGANLVYDFKPLHDACVAAPAQCADKAHDYVQDTVRRFPSANAGTAPSQSLPSDRDAFMATLAAELAQMLPADKVEVDGMTLNVTRPGGHAIPFDQNGYYKLCGQSNFQCAAPMRQSLVRTAAWLTPLEPARLRVSLHVMASCNIIASVGNTVTCHITPGHEPMAPIFRRAFANLEEICYKQLDDGTTAPATNADRHDLDLDVDGALDRCDAGARDALGPLPATLPAPSADGIGTLSGPYAASHAIFASEWPRVAAANGGHLIVAVPTRDMLLYMNGDSPAQIAALGTRAAALATASPLGISTDVYRWTGDGWSLATDGSTMPTEPVGSTDVLPHVH